jgi:competence protein ComEC
MKSNKINKYLIIGITSIIFIYLGIYIYKWEYREPLLEVHFFSLTRGRAVFIRTPENKTILIGGGQTSETIRELTRVMPFYKRNIDYVVIPSAVPAQIGGLVEILDRYEIGEVIVSKIIATSTALEAVTKKIHVKVHEVERGDEIMIEKGINMNILFPYSGFKFNKTSLPELGMSISYSSTTAYFLGNLSKTIHKDISKNIETQNNENILEFYHSAIPTKVSPDLIKKIDPAFTFTTKEKATLWVSDGMEWKNR